MGRRDTAIPRGGRVRALGLAKSSSTCPRRTGFGKPEACAYARSCLCVSDPERPPAATRSNNNLPQSLCCSAGRGLGMSRAAGSGAQRSEEPSHPFYSSTRLSPCAAVRKSHKS